jgi:hypothetical protein
MGFRHEQSLSSACGPAATMPKHSMKIHHARAVPEYPARAVVPARLRPGSMRAGLFREHLRRFFDDLNP